MATGAYHATDWVMPWTVRIVLTVAAAVAAGAMLLTAAPEASGAEATTQFGTTRLLGQDFEHERMTRAALACPPGTKSDGSCFEPLSMDQLAGKAGTFGGVGAPDEPLAEPAPAHCDDADFLNIPGYPRTLAQKTRAFRACRGYMRIHWLRRGVMRSPALLDNRDRIIPRGVNLNPDCTFPRNARDGRAKCDVFAGFGRALHAMQDFYSHSNWSDRPVAPAAVGINNPPGLSQLGLAPLLDMRLAAMPAIPAALTSGCFELRELTALAPRTCAGRIRHLILKKDNGPIRANAPAAGADPAAAATIDNTTGLKVGQATAGPRGKVATNFRRAVLGAMRETRRQWDDFRFELIQRYGAKRGTLMICALTRDNPVRDCQGRRLGIVIDSSGSNVTTDPGNLRVAAGMIFNSGLVTAEQAGAESPADYSAVIAFDDGARVVSPLGDPSLASFAGIDAGGGTNIAAGVNLAIDELVKDMGEPTSEPAAGRSGMVVLTDGQDSNLAALIAALNRARDAQIRVSFGFLSPPSEPVVPQNFTQPGLAAIRPIVAERVPAGRKQAPPPELVAAILETGGFYGTIDSPEAQASFIDIVVSSGATALDDPNGADDGGALQSGVDVSGRASGTKDTDIWTFTGVPGRVMTIRVLGLAGQDLTFTVRDAKRGQELLRARTTNGVANLRARFRQASEAEIEVKPRGKQVGTYTIGLAEVGVDLRGTGGKNRLRCGPTSTYVLAGAGNDRVICTTGDDMIVGGPGADDLSGGKGEDVFLVARRDLARGVERINGGPGTDLVEFAFDKPRGLRCAGRSRIVVPASAARASWVLTKIEVVTFNGRRC